MGKTSLSIKRNINISSDKTVFIGNETGEYAKSQTNKLPKVDMSRAWQAALGAIPSIGTPKGTESEVIKTYIAQVALGSIPVVVGSSEAFNPANWKNGNVNTLFADSLYRGAISGVHTGAATTELKPKTMVSGVSLQVGWVKDENTGKWKYLNQNGEAEKGWKKVDGKWYYFDGSGYMSTGWRSVDGKIYYFHSSGDMLASGWVQDKNSGKMYWADTEGVINNKNGIGYDETTKDLIIKYEGSPFLEVRINSSPDSYTIGYGYDFSEKNDLDMFNRFLTRSSTGEIVKKDVRMTQGEAEKLIKVVADKKGITVGVNDFIIGLGSGNTQKSLFLTQNQYNALFSYFYSNGKNVFSDKKYEEWIGLGGEYARRAEARKELRDYIINNNGKYDPKKIKELFINSKGGNIKYDYKDRREGEAQLFTK